MISASIAAAGKEFSQSGKKKARYTFTSPRTGKKYRWTRSTDPTDEDIQRLIELDNQAAEDEDLVAAANRNLSAAVSRDKAARPDKSQTGAQVLGQGLRGMAKDISDALLPIETAARDNYLSAMIPGNAASLLLRGKPILNLKEVLPKEAAPVIDALRPSSLVTDPMDVAGQFLVDPKQASYDQFGKAFDPNAPALDRILTGLNIAGLIPGAYGAVKGIQKIAKGAKKGAKAIETVTPVIEDAEKTVQVLFRKPKREYQNRLDDIKAAEQNGLLLPDDAEELRRKLRSEFEVPEPVAQATATTPEVTQPASVPKAEASPPTSQSVVPPVTITPTAKPPSTQPVGQPVAAPNRAAASNFASQNIRDEFELGPLPEPERRRWETVTEEARRTYNADAIDAKIADPTSQFTDTDIAQSAMRSAELRDALRNASPEAYDDIEEKLLNHTLRLQQLGTRQGQALAARNLAVLEDYSYDGAYRRIAGAMKARNVNDVSRETREKVKTITTELESATAKRDQLKKSLNAERAKIAEKVVTGETSKRRRATASDLKRREELLKKIQANRAKYISSVPAQWLFDSADDIKELARIQIMMGADKLDDVRAAVVAQLRASGMDIDDGEFDAVLAGEFNNKMARQQVSEYQRLVAEARAARKSSDEGRIKAAEDRMRLLEQSIQDRIDRQLSRTKAGRDLLDAEKAVNVRKIEIDQMVRAARDNRRYEELSPGMKALAQVTGATRGLVLGADLGSLTNQGAFALLTRPVSAIKAAGSGLKAVRGDKALVNELAKIRSDKRFNAAVNAGLDIKSVLGDGRNEFYVSDAINKLPGYKQGQLFFDAQVAALRMNAFNSYVDSLTRMKLRTGGGKITDDEYKMIAEMVNTTNGSGTGELATRLKAVNQKYGVLLAPGFRISRIKAALGTPVLNAVKNKNYRLATILLGDYLRFLGGVAGMAAGIKIAGGDVETDPRSTDFMRFRKGNVNVSLASGLEDPIKKIVQAMTGSIKSREEGDDPSKPSKGKLGVNSFIDWFTQSLSPFYSSASMIAEQGVQRAIAEPGEELTFKKFGKNVDLMEREGQINVAKSQLPIWLQSSWDLFEDSELDDTQKLYLSLASALGVRVNVKPPKESK